MNGNLLKISAHRHMNEYILRENTFSQEIVYLFWNVKQKYFNYRFRRFNTSDMGWGGQFESTLIY